MQVKSSLAGNGAVIERPLEIGATVVTDQVVCSDANIYAEVGAPASVNDYTEAHGVTLEAGTYAATQANGSQRVRVALSPFHTYIGKCSGGVTAGTDLAFALDSNLLTNSTLSAAGTVISDTNVGTSEFAGGLVVGLTGGNKGRARIITSHIDNTSTTVTKPFTDDLAVNDTFVRTFGRGNQGLELTTNFVEFNMVPGAGVDLPDTGHAVVTDVYIDGFKVVNFQHVEVLNTTQPAVEVEFVFIDHAFNSVA